MGTTDALHIVTRGDPGYEDVRHVYSATGSPARVRLPVDAEQTGSSELTVRRTGSRGHKMWVSKVAGCGR